MPAVLTDFDFPESDFKPLHLLFFINFSICRAIELIHNQLLHDKINDNFVLFTFNKYIS